MHRMHVLLAEDDDFLRQSLGEQLAEEGFAVTEATTAAQAAALATQQPFDALLLAAPLPDSDGAELCRRLRDHGISAPILMMVAGPDGQDTATTRAAGADDRVTKPFRIGHLLSRLRATLQRTHGEAAAFRIGPYVFQPVERTLIDPQERRIPLTDKEAAILRHLYRAGRMIAREALLDEVWGYNPGVTTHTLETHIYRLRRKIEADPANACILVTEPGGYRLIP